jgi:acetyl-CoA carboxylase biotin carboxyl carrier protein
MKTLEAICEKSQKGVAVKSPAVGYISHLPSSNQIIAGAPAGRLQVLGTTYLLTLPPHAQGRVEGVEMERRIRPVAYEEALFTLAPIEAQEFKESKESTTSHTSQGGKIIVVSPTDGIFYRRPSPDAPYYVEVGSIVKSGQALGLVEVMKCFNQITFSGANFPAEAKVLEICVADAVEVKYQQPLFILG